MIFNFFLSFLLYTEHTFDLVFLHFVLLINFCHTVSNLLYISFSHRFSFFHFPTIQVSHFYFIQNSRSTKFKRKDPRHVEHTVAERVRIKGKSGWARESWCIAFPRQIRLGGRCDLFWWKARSLRGSCICTRQQRRAWEFDLGSTREIEITCIAMHSHDTAHTSFVLRSLPRLLNLFPSVYGHYVNPRKGSLPSFTVAFHLANRS